MFIPAYIFKTDKLTDLSYALTFIFLIFIAFFLSPFSFEHIIVASMIVLRGLRLWWFLFMRIRRIKYDKRFDGIRESFPKFFKFWILQWLTVWIILIPALVFIQSTTHDVFLLGGIVWLIWLLVESIGDWQKYIFTQNSNHKGQFIQSWLRKYSRHPNYFGEILCRIGIYIFVLPSLSLRAGIFGLISPIFIIFLLVFVTGLPPLEKQADIKWGKMKEYIYYKKNTSILIPWIRTKQK